MNNQSTNISGLIPLNRRPEEEARRIRSAGGKARAAKTKKEGLIREGLAVMLTRRISDQQREALSGSLPDGAETYLEAMALGLILAAGKGSVPAAAFIRDTLGEAPGKEAKEEPRQPEPTLKERLEMAREAQRELKSLGYAEE